MFTNTMGPHFSLWQSREIGRVRKARRLGKSAQEGCHKLQPVRLRDVAAR
jgi:hypothetical protein